jgi:multisubunit Na+/H+ antiporter MnhC subunit
MYKLIDECHSGGCFEQIDKSYVNTFVASTTYEMIFLKDMVHKIFSFLILSLKTNGYIIQS